MTYLCPCLLPQPTVPVCVPYMKPSSFFAIMLRLIEAPVSPSVQLRLCVPALAPSGPECVLWCSFCVLLLPPTRFLCGLVLWCDLPSTTAVTASIVVQLHGSDAPLAGPSNVLSMRASPQISPDLACRVYRRGASLSPRGWGTTVGKAVLSTAVLCGIDWSMPGVGFDLRQR